MRPDATPRRLFLSDMLATLAALPAARVEGIGQKPEVPTLWADVTPGATFWAALVFTSDEPIEITIKAGNAIKSVRGRFNAQRLAQYSWHNATSATQQVGVRAKSLVGDRELSGSIHYISEQSLSLAFGRRATPGRAEDRRGAYPYDAIVLGLIIYGE